MPRKPIHAPGAHESSPNARRHALEASTEALSPKGRGFAQELLEERFAHAPLKPEDRRLATDLTYGVIRRLGTLDAVLQSYSARRLDSLDPVVHQILRQGLYQLLFLERIPAHAAVDESVNLARATGKHKATGFVNGVLRNILRDMKFQPEADPSNPRRSFEIAPGRVVQFGRPVLPPVEETAKHMAALYSFPEVLTSRWIARYGEAEARRLCAVSNELPPTFVRPNRTKISPEALLQRLQEEGVEAVPSLSGRTIRLSAHTVVSRLKSFEEGLFQVQDDSSAAVADFIGAAPEEKVLDMAAAPGGKTCHMAERMERRGQIIAVDSSAARLKRVVENMQRLDLPIIAIVESDGAHFAEENAGTFDRVLLDAPCTNTGVLRRRVEARWRFSEVSLTEIVKIQRPLLEAGLRAVRPGGVFVYSTCSLEPEENGDLVRAVLATRPACRLDDEKQMLPQHEGGDGLYMARIVVAG